MHLRELRGGAFRNFRDFAVDLSPRFNVLYGANGAGKTSFLEAVYFLARAKSFRATRADKLIGDGADRCWVFGTAERDGARHSFGVERQKGRTRARRDGEDIQSLSHWASYWPVEVINSEAQRFVVDGPAIRRSFLNWGVFHVEHRYGALWRRFRRILEQCNAALRSGDPRQAQAWEASLAGAADEIDQCRHAFVDRLSFAAEPSFRQWLPEHDVTLRYRRGWRADTSLLDLLRANRDQALRMGHVLQGPQRADMQLLSGGEEAQHRLSRGQQKIAVMALTLGKMELMAQTAQTTPLLLVDDLPAELDADRRRDVLHALENVPAQVFATCIERKTMAALTTEPRWFHVEHGQVSTMV